MAEFNPDEYLAQKRAEAPFDPDAYLRSKLPPPAMGTGESLLRGAGQGLSLGFLDELAGAAASPLGAIKEAGKYVGIEPNRMSKEVKDYIKARDAMRAGNSQAAEEHPYAYYGGDLAGGLALPLGSVLGGATKGARALQAAGLGGAAALGSTSTQDVGGQAKDVGIGAALGGTITPLAENAGNLIKKGLNIGLDVPEVVSNRYLANPEAVNSAASKEQLGQRLADTLGEVRGDTGALNNSALAALPSHRAPVQEFSVTDAVSTLRSFKDSEAHQLADKLEREASERMGDLSMQHGNFLNAQEMHEVKKTLQGMGNWKSALPQHEAARANQESGKLNQILRDVSPEYAQGMADTSANIQVKQNLANKFAIRPDRGKESGFAPTDRTYSAMNDIVRANKFDRQNVLNDLSSQGYGNMTEDIQNTAAKDLLSGSGRTAGSRKAVMGAALGGGLGHMTGIPGAGWVGSALGSVAGGAADKYGPQAGKKILDAGVALQKLSSSPMGQKFVAPIQKAAQQGPMAFSVTHFLMQQTEPEYQKAMQENNE